VPLIKYYYGYKTKEDEMGVVFGTLVGNINTYRILVGKPTRSWTDNIKMDPKEIEWDDVEWIILAYDRYRWRDSVKTIMNLRVL
jgi:hypothetical protein